MRILDWMDEPRTRTGLFFAPDDPGADWAFAPYADLADGALRAAGLLTRLGLRRGGVVAILMPEPRDFLLAFYGALAAGGTPCPLATPLTFRSLDVYTSHLTSVLQSAEPAIVLVDPALHTVVEQAISPLSSSPALLSFTAGSLEAEEPGSRKDPADHALLQFTSGSSGVPKGVQVTAENLYSNVAMMSKRLAYAPDDVYVSWLPHYHDMGLIGGLILQATFGIGLRLIKPVQFIRNPMIWLECLSHTDGTITAAPSFGYAYTARRVKPADLEGFDFSSWRVAGIAAERTDPAGIRRFVELAEPHGFSRRSLSVAYGLAEATLAVTGTCPGEPVQMVQLEHGSLRDAEPIVISQKAVLGDAAARSTWLTSCGMGDETVQVDIVDEQGNTLPERHLGQIKVRGLGVAQGYKSAPHAQTTTSFLDNALLTGDTGFLLDGELYVIGRMGDSIKVRGVKLYAEDLDAQITAATGLHAGRHTALLGTIGSVDVVVSIVEHPEGTWLPSVHATLSSLTAENIAIAIFRGQPGTVERTSSGKPRRRVLWRRLLEGDLPVELVHTNWAEISPDPAPWEHELATASD